jgi:integrase/recombinase XerD
MESFASWCVGRGSSPSKVRGLLAGLRRLVSWFARKHTRSLEELSEDDIADAQRYYYHRAPQLARVVEVLGEFLRVGAGLKPRVPLRQFRPRVWRIYADLPVVGGILDEYVRWCVDWGFKPSTILLHLDGLHVLGRWLRRRGKGSLAEVTAADFEQARRFYRVRRPWVAAAIRRLGGLLKQQGRLRPAVLTLAEKEMAGFEAHLREECGLSQGTISSQAFYVRSFLKFLGGANGRPALAELKLPAVHRFVCRMARRCSRRSMAHVVGMLRKFLRFEFLKGALREPLHLHLGSVKLWRDEGLPRALPWPQLQKMLRRAERSTPLGRRDFAILLLAASYGLRGSEVAALRLDDIDWRAGLLRVRTPKTGGCLRLPLTGEVAAALVDYLQHGRPASAERRLFVRVRAPASALGGTGVALCLARAVRATGVDILHPNFHALRHAFAMRLLLTNTALEHISGVMGHRSVDSTSVYLRLDVEDLRQVALPVPRAVKLTALQACAADAGDGIVSKSKRHRSPSATVASKGWRSFLARPMQDFLRMHRALGRGYRAEEWVLRKLDGYLARRQPAGRVFTAAMFEGWAAGQAAVGPTTRRCRMLLVRKFTLYLARTVPGTVVPDSHYFPKAQPCAAPCLLSQRDVARLLAATHWPKAVRTAEHPLRPKTMHLAVLLLYCCGLRVGELLRLRLGDIDTEKRVLRIDQTKFHKSRLVPLCASVSEQLRKYLRARRAHHTPAEASAPLIWSGAPNSGDDAFSRSGLRYNWRLLCRHAGVFNHLGRAPRIHDLRHSFAVAVLQRAFQQGRNAPQAMLPRLVRYMGHAGFEFTHHYLHFTESLRLAASERFGQLLTPLSGAPLHFHPPKARAR